MTYEDIIKKLRTYRAQLESAQMRINNPHTPKCQKEADIRHKNMLLKKIQELEDYLENL